MRHFARSILSLVVLALLAGPAAAQRQGERGERGDRADRGGPGVADRGPALGMLLRNKSVQEELNLSNEQVRKVDAALSEIFQKHRQEFEALRSGNASERVERLSALRRKMDEETREALRGDIQPEQIRRLRQIRLQARGADALASPRLQESLDLTADQKSKIHEINEDAHEDAREIFRDAGDDRAAAMRKLQALHKETMDRACAVLTDKQKAQYKEMAGEPFEIKWEGRRGGDNR